MVTSEQSLSPLPHGEKIAKSHRLLNYHPFVNVALVMLMLFVFLVGVKTLEGAVKIMGADVAKTLFDLSTHPIICLFVGLFATVLVQSSSATTSMIVGLVSSGSLPIPAAIPMIMGANMGTSVTNTIVSLGYVKNIENFKRAFAAGTIHDFFNVLTVLILLPLEMMTGVFEKSSYFIAELMFGSSTNLTFESPIKAAIKPVVYQIKTVMTQITSSEAFTSGAMAVAGAAIILVSLIAIVKIMHPLLQRKGHEVMDQLLKSNPFVSIGLGLLVTVLVQSSSITTSMIIPFAGAGVMSLEAILPVTIGANIGTTTTALMAAMVGSIHGLAIALVHLLFNIAGALIWFPHPRMRRVPIRMSEGISRVAEKSRIWAIVYLLVFFFILPIVLISLGSGFKS